MAKRKNPNENKIYRLRDPKTGLFHGLMKSNEPTFTKRGKDWKTYAAAADHLVRYNYDGMGKKWPKLEVVTFETKEAASVTDNTRDLRAAKLFNEKHDLLTYFGLGRFILNLAASGVEFRYVIHARGSHPIKFLDTARVSRNGTTQHYDRCHSDERGETLVAVNDETELIFLKMMLADHLIGIWDYKTRKKIG